MAYNLDIWRNQIWTFRVDIVHLLHEMGVHRDGIQREENVRRPLAFLAMNHKNC